MASEFIKNAESSGIPQELWILIDLQMALPNFKDFIEAFFTFMKYLNYGAIPVHEILLQFFNSFCFSPL